MMNSLNLIGCNHSTANLAVREHIAFSSDNIEEGLIQLNNLAGVEAGMIISTCNRMEICYIGTASTNRVFQWMLEFHDFRMDRLSNYFYFHQGQEVLRHLVRVASGLDSMVIGEPQVFGQVKDAYKMAKERGFLRGSIDSAFQQVFAIAKKIRTNTRLGEKSLSLAAVAISLAEERLQTMIGRTALIVGAGHNASLIARYLKDRNIANMYIANRSHDKARKLAQNVNGHSFALMDIAQYIQSVDIVFTSTTSPTIIITKDMVAKAMNVRNGESLFIADLSVPRDVESSVNELEGVYFVILDDLQKMSKNNHQHRNRETRQAEMIIDFHINHLISAKQKVVMEKAVLRSGQ